MTTQTPFPPSSSTPQWEPCRSSPSTGFVPPPRFQQLQAQAAHQQSQPAQNHLQFPSSNHPSPANNFSTDSSSEMPSHTRSPSFFSSFRRQSNESQSNIQQRAIVTNGSGTNLNPPTSQQNAPSTPMQQVQPRPQTNSNGQQQPQTPQQIPPNSQPPMGQQQGAAGRTTTDVQPAPTAPSPSTGQSSAPLHPEIRSVVQLTTAHAHKIYFSGPLVRRIERQADGQRPTKDEGWVDVWAQLGGTTLSVWDMKEIQEASKQGREVPPTYVNVTDAFVQVLGSVTVPATAISGPKRYTNVLTLNTAGSNLLLFSCPSTNALISWAAALRLSAWEKSRLEEIYTAHLIRITLSARDIPTTLVRGRMEGWARIRIAGQTDWKRVWMVVSASDGAEGSAPLAHNPTLKKKRMSSLFSREQSPPQPTGPTKASISMYSSPKPKDRKRALLTVTDITQVFSVYPERHELISRSTLIKVEGLLGDEELAAGMRSREGWLLVMPELDPTSGQVAKMLMWIVAMHDAFGLYGRPKGWTWDPRDRTSLMFGYPVGPQKESLFLECELVESLDPRDDRTSIIRSRLVDLLVEQMHPAVQAVPRRSAAQQNGGDYGTDDIDEEEGEEKEERNGLEEEEKEKREEDGSKRSEAEDTRQGWQDWDSSDFFGHIYCDGLSTTKPISAALLQRPPFSDDSVPHFESIQERLCQLEEMDLSESRILFLEKIHQEMWAELPTIGFIKWNDLPWPVFVRTTCPKDLMLHRIVSYLLQVSGGMDIKEVLVDSNRLQWAQQRLRILLNHWGQPGLQKKVENSADKTIIQGVIVVTNHLKSVLGFVNTYQTQLTPFLFQPFIKHVGQSLARILTDTSDNSGYKALLRLKGESAQKMLNFLQMLLDCSELVSLPRNDVLGALLRLSKSSKLYPECLTITDLERDDDVLDSGRFGEIYKGRSRNQAICLKVIKVNQKTQIKHLLKTVFKEALLWGHLSHPNILPFYGLYHLEDTHERISFVSPWMENGNVTEYLKRHPHANRLLLIWDIIPGIQFLHQNQVIHGDLKGLNVLVNRSGRCCLADFGLANLVDEDILRWTSIQTTVHESSGTLRWQAPELIDPPSDESAKATTASDIYSFACVCYEICTGHIPFHKIIRNSTVMKKVLEGSRPPRPADTSLLPDEIWKVIEMCWNQEPQDRPSAESVIEQLPLAGVVDDRPSGDDHLAPSDFRAENLGVMFDPAVDIILFSVLRSTRTNEVEPHTI